MPDISAFTTKNPPKRQTEQNISTTLSAGCHSADHKEPRCEVPSGILARLSDVWSPASAGCPCPLPKCLYFPWLLLDSNAPPAEAGTPYNGMRLPESRGLVRP